MLSGSQQSSTDADLQSPQRYEGNIFPSNKRHTKTLRATSPACISLWFFWSSGAEIRAAWWNLQLACVFWGTLEWRNAWNLSAEPWCWVGMLPTVPSCVNPWLLIPGCSWETLSQERGAWHQPKVVSTPRLCGAGPLGALLLPEAPIPRESFTGEAVGRCSDENVTINER